MCKYLFPSNVPSKPPFLYSVEHWKFNRLNCKEKGIIVKHLIIVLVFVISSSCLNFCSFLFTLIFVLFGSYSSFSIMLWITYDMFHFTGIIENVKLHVDLSVTFLEDFILSRSYKTWNAFFSGSGKSKQVIIIIQFFAVLNCIKHVLKQWRSCSRCTHWYFVSCQ